MATSIHRFEAVNTSGALMSGATVALYVAGETPGSHPSGEWLATELGTSGRYWVDIEENAYDIYINGSLYSHNTNIFLTGPDVKTHIDGHGTGSGSTIATADLEDGAVALASAKISGVLDETNVDPDMARDSELHARSHALDSGSDHTGVCTEAQIPDLTTAGYGATKTIEAGCIEDKFVRNDAGDVMGGVLTCDGIIVTTGNEIETETITSPSGQDLTITAVGVQEVVIKKDKRYLMFTCPVIADQTGAVASIIPRGMLQHDCQVTRVGVYCNDELTPSANFAVQVADGTDTIVLASFAAAYKVVAGTINWNVSAEDIKITYDSDPVEAPNITVVLEVVTV